MAKNLPTTTGNVVADVGKAVANEIELLCLIISQKILNKKLQELQ